MIEQLEITLKPQVSRLSLGDQRDYAAVAKHAMVLCNPSNPCSKVFYCNDGSHVAEAPDGSLSRVGAGGDAMEPVARSSQTFS